jgi:hypothetical protein
MYQPTGTEPVGGWSTDPYDRAAELIGAHPAYRYDDTVAEYDTGDTTLNDNQDNGTISQQYFEYAWKIAGLMLGDEFWNDGYVWSNVLGEVATRVYSTDLEQLSGSVFSLPSPTWNSTSNMWDFGIVEYYWNGVLWGVVETYEDVAVSGHDEVNAFLRYIMDIDALTVQDVDGDGVYDEDEDYILFSLVDDGRYTRSMTWGATRGAAVEWDLDGEFFDGDTVFMYHGGEVTTYFDPGTGVFFGETTTLESTTWATVDYELAGFDIYFTETVVPEPATMILVIGAGLALGAGVIRRRIH